MLYKVVLTFKRVDNTPRGDHSNGSLEHVSFIWFCFLLGYFANSNYIVGDFFFNFELSPVTESQCRADAKIDPVAIP